MNIEIAQKLKDEGFPEQTRIAVELNLRRYRPLQPVDAPSFPFLQELISEARAFKGFDFGLIWDCDHKEWTAFRGFADGFWEFRGSGSTPEEAVANLWLANNKK